MPTLNLDKIEEREMATLYKSLQQITHQENEVPEQNFTRKTEVE